MGNPFWRLQTWPRGRLWLASVLVVTIATVGDILVDSGLIWLMGSLESDWVPLLVKPGVNRPTLPDTGHPAPVTRSKVAAFTPQSTRQVLPVGAGFGLGAWLGLREQAFPQIYLHPAPLWILVAWLALTLLLKSRLSLPFWLVTLGYSQMVGALLGIFVTGERQSK